MPCVISTYQCNSAGSHGVIHGAIEKNNRITLAGFVITFLGAVLFSTKAIIIKVAFAHTAIDALTLAHPENDLFPSVL